MGAYGLNKMFIFYAVNSIITKYYSEKMFVVNKNRSFSKLQKAF